MADIREVPWGGLKYTEREESFLRNCATLLGMDATEVVRTCLAIALPSLLANDFIGRTDLKDIIPALRESVRSSLDASKQKE